MTKRYTLAELLYWTAFLAIWCALIAQYSLPIAGWAICLAWVAGTVVVTNLVGAKWSALYCFAWGTAWLLFLVLVERWGSNGPHKLSLGATLAIAAASGLAWGTSVWISVIIAAKIISWSTRYGRVSVR